MARQATYQWHLREVMAARGMFTTTDLVPRLADRGITLSPSQVHRLVTGTPERLPHRFDHACARCAGRLTTGTRNHAAEQFTYAARFLAWLAARQQHLADTTQADIDDWHVTHPSHYGKLRGFLTWAITTRHAPPLDVPAGPRTTREPITQDRRLTLLRRGLTDDAGPFKDGNRRVVVAPDNLVPRTLNSAHQPPVVPMKDIQELGHRTA